MLNADFNIWTTGKEDYHYISNFISSLLLNEYTISMKTLNGEFKIFGYERNFCGIFSIFFSETILYLIDLCTNTYVFRINYNVLHEQSLNLVLSDFHDYIKQNILN